MRSESIAKINSTKQDSRFVSNQKNKPISEYFGKLVFGPEEIKKFVMRDAYDHLMEAIETGERIERNTADFIAVGMKNWAMENGATHFTHWFQPMTGATAEKHDSFFRLDKHGNAIEAFNGEVLIQQEPDASSFPSGGLRDTSAARGYTVWDPSSYAFLQESKYGKTLCIPAIFISYTGESLDLKTPLLKSIHAINNIAVQVVNYFNPEVKKVTPTLGWEQEYFVVDEALFNARPDLLLCGRTLFGSNPARGQQLEDHYFGAIPERVIDFMHDFEDDCHMLGIPLTTRHNEVAPTQFEVAPYFEFANTAADHNQLLMSIIDKIAKRHQLRALLHEKPYAGINGSGKHNNWSLATNTGENLLNPGDNPKNNLQFLTFFINTIKAVDKYANVLRASIATAGNEHRLGANEAPPAIISVYTGEVLENILNDFRNGKETEDGDITKDLVLDVPKIAKIKKDQTDRNRTSPFPFTGNRFEFRAVGSSVNVSNPMTVLNTMVADQLTSFKSEVDGLINSGTEKTEAIKQVLRNYLNQSWNIIFNGNGYKDEWVKEAEKRGLANIKSTPEALKEYLKPEIKNLFIRNGIYNEKEIQSRYNIYVEEYIKHIDIEARLIREIVNSMLIPAVIKYQNNLISNVKSLIDIGMTNESEVIKGRITELSHLLKGMIAKTNEIEKKQKHAHGLESEVEIADYMCNTVKPLFDEARYFADSLEKIIDDNIWPLPKYRELLFLH